MTETDAFHRTPSQTGFPSCLQERRNVIFMVLAICVAESVAMPWSQRIYDLQLKEGGADEGHCLLAVKKQAAHHTSLQDADAVLTYIDKREAELNEAKPATEAKGPGCRQKQSWQVQDPWPFDMAWAQQVVCPMNTYR